jgi:Domain of unknown function (DUF5658)
MTHMDENGRIERRSGVERRRVGLATYWYGSLNPRRRAGRRATDLHYPVIDWHSPRVLALVMSILGLGVLDGVLTVLLISNGATEVNPVMARFLPHDLGLFAAVKLSLTALGVLVLVACSRMRLFKAIPGEALLVAVVVCYIALVAYELRMLAAMPFTGS